MSEQQNIQQPEIHQAAAQEQEIDLIALIKRLWKKRKFVIYVTAGFMVLGLLVALFSKKEFTSNTVFVPQTSSESMAKSSVSQLASMAGVSLSEMGGGDQLSPMVYPKLLSNAEFMKELMYTPMKFEEWPEHVTLIDYYTNPEYNKPSFFGAIAKYTIGLPGLLIKAIKGDKEVDSTMMGQNTIPVYTQDEYDCAKILSELVSITINDKDGYIELAARMPEAYVSAQVATVAFNLLEKYITGFKIEKAKATLDYVNDRLAEAKADFEAKQLEYAQYRDANRSLSTATAMIMEEKLRKEYDLSNTIYTELARQKTQVELQVKEDTPVLSVVQPVVVPIEKSKPKRAIILIAFTFLGGCLGCAGVFGLDFLKHQGSSWPRGWKTEEEEEADKEVVA